MARKIYPDASMIISMVTNNSRPSVIVDSSSLVALLKLDDLDHARAIKIMDGTIASQELSVLVPWEILAETLNIIGKKQGKQASVIAGQALMERESAADIKLARTNIATLRRALDLQITATGSPSFIDCLVMAHANQQQTSFIFGFDAAFQKNGYSLPGNL